MILRHIAATLHLIRAPRVSGDDPGTHSERWDTQQCSPRERG